MPISDNAGHRIFVSKVISFLLSHDCTLTATYDEGSNMLRVGGEYHHYDINHPEGGYDACEVEYIPPTWGAARRWLGY